MKLDDAARTKYDVDLPASFCTPSSAKSSASVSTDWKLWWDRVVSYGAVYKLSRRTTELDDRNDDGMDSELDSYKLTDAVACRL